MKLKLTKKQESEVLKAYNAYWDAYLHGDWRKNAAFLDENIYMIGTTAEEVYHNKKQVTQFFRDTAKEVKGKIQFRNRKQVVVPADSNVLVNEEFDLFIKAGKEWSFYSRVRLTSVMKEGRNGWKFIQQHGSVPDLRTQQGETIAFDKISQENIQLRDAVNRRTVELQQKNQELAIESALERVRTVAMAMKKPEDMLDICRVISKELEGLGLKEIRNVQTVIIDQHKAHYLNYEYYRLQKKTFITPIAYKENRKINRFVQQILKDAEGFYTSTKKGTELEEWLVYQAQSGQFVDPHLKKAKSLHYYFYSIGTGALGISTYAPLDKEQIICFRRFRNVFQLSYQRFVDIQIAETQAREAKIEASLERMRARAMAMHKPDELLDAAELLNKELSHLGIDGMNVSYALVDEDKKADFYYSGNQVDGRILPFPYIFPHNETEPMRAILSSWQKQHPFNVIELNEKATVKHQTYIANHIKQQLAKNDIPFSIDDFLSVSPKKAVLSTFNFSKGYLFHIGGARLTSIQEDIMLRATRVFDQTYRRFLDLQKAESQARESQIQLALERVRAKTMAMHKSDELSEVVALLYKQFVELDFGLYQILISIVNTDKNRIEWWSRGFQDTEVPVCYFIPFVDHPFPNMQMQKWRSGEIYHAHVLEGELKRSWEKYLFTQTDLKHFPKEIKRQMQGIERVYLSDAFMKHGVLQAAGPSPLSPDKADILIRFAKVLDQAYTRMSDLQKAEAQAREAKIEVALERVRSRTMGMQKSEELREVIQVVYDQFVHLDIPIEHTGFIIDYKERDDMNIWLADQHAIPFQVTIPYFDCAHWNSFIEAKEKGKDFFANKLSFEEKNKFYKELFELIPGLPEEAQEYYFNCPGLAISTVLLENVGLYIENFQGVPYTDEENATLMRFGKVFQQTYTRFLDLKNAEAQAREAKIEAGLEKVRGRAMAMQKSDELQELITTVYKELTKLDLVLDRCFISIFDPSSLGSTWWMAAPETTTGVMGLFMKYHESPPYLAHLKAWKERQAKWQYILEGDVKKTWDDYIFKETEFSLVPPDVIENMKAQQKVYLNASYNAFGCLSLATLHPLSEEQFDVMIRFAKVFDLTYTRLNDLKQAEAQAREARIEAALEKVRGRAMAMQKSDELQALIGTVSAELTKLELVMERCFIAIFDPLTRGCTWWMASSETDGGLIGLFMQYHEYPPYLAYLEGWDKREVKWQYILEGSIKKDWDEFIFQETEFSLLPEVAISNMKAPGKVFLNASFNAFGCLTLATLEPLTEDQSEILIRMARVFDLTYTRFNDLKQAEAQAKEAQVEAALERVRSKTMAMHNSQDVAETVSTLFNQLLKLGVRIYRCGIGIMDESGTIELWTARPGVEEKADLVIGYLDMNSHPLFKGAYEGWKNKEETFCYELKGDDVIEYYTTLNSQPNYQVKYELDKLPPQLFHNDFYFNEGTLFVFSLEQLSADESAVLKRFTAVFGQTYRRFLDLQRAEAQAREAQIEASLERVRAKAMAMHSSEELATTISTFYREIEMLSITPIRCGVAMVDKDSKIAELVTMNTTESGESFVVMGHIKMEGHRILEEAFDHWLQQKEYHASLRGSEINEYYKVLRPQIDFPEYPHDEVQYGYYFMFKEGDVYAWTEKPLTEEQLKIYRRFTTVLSLTFKRYKDLQHAEVQARVANIEVALERVRAKALAMQEPEELQDVAQVLRNEMGALGVEELETASIYIHEKDSTTAECWYALKDPTDASKKMVADQFHLNLEETWVGREMKKFYLSDEKQTSIVMKGEKRREWINYCYQHSPVFSGYYGETIPDRTYHLYKFSHGYIGAAAPGDISAESWRLLSRAASVFSLAYSRFKDLTQARFDLQRLKEEKQRAESALSELKSTQTQLIQAEKMASLGELTAGIAHEIQNPLNFVNNFSELSNELIEEMKDELLKEHKGEAIQLIENIKQNLEKINFHGRRADAIVKNMLQHSRSSSGQKEFTDINSLADEYLRLAYHGFRAKDKSFNSKFETQLDKRLEKIKVVPQEMGRVILNLINNAFYAVSEKKKKNLPGYEPLVKVSTLQTNGRTEISIMDNGIGIPKQVLNKIFQPFFTTKPTGQGTGLGLSLSYDIITKGHGGELKVNTQEGEGTEFVIQLPNSDSPH